MMWLENDSRLVHDEGYLVIGDLAPSVDLCGAGCSGCNEAWYSNNGNTFYTCTDTTVYKYSNKCESYPLQELCSSEDIANGRCYFSWPHDDTFRQRSDDFSCRPLPDTHVSGNWVYD